MKTVCIFFLMSLVGSPLVMGAPPKVNCDNFYDVDNPDDDTDDSEDNENVGDTDGFYESNNPYADSYNDDDSWKIASAESQGLNPQKLNDASAYLANLKNSLSFLVIRNNKIVMERFFNGSRKSDANNIHSASKSMISAAVGKALQEGHIRSIDQKISDFLPSYFASISDPLKKEITIRDLLTMRSGLEWKEDGTETWVETQPDWIEAILSLPMARKPGEKFQYSTASTHLLSAILTKATGLNTCQYVHNKIFEKIGIAAEHWGRDPNGIFSGGYNVYLTPREMAKFGLLYLHDGKWQGKQVLPSAWVNSSLQPQTFAKEDINYGYNWWVKSMRGHNVGIANGFGGQYIFVVKDLNLVVVITANTKDFNKDMNFKNIVEDFILPAIKN